VWPRHQGAAALCLRLGYGGLATFRSDTQREAITDAFAGQVYAWEALGRKARMRACNACARAERAPNIGLGPEIFLGHLIFGFPSALPCLGLAVTSLSCLELTSAMDLLLLSSL